MIDLFQDIKITKGYNRSLLQDLTKGKFELISNEVFEILNQIKTYNSLSECLLKNNEYEAELLNLKALNIFNECISEDNIFPAINESNLSSSHFQSITFNLSIFVIDYIKNNIEILSKLTQNIFLVVSDIESEFFLFLSDYLKENQHVRIVFCGNKSIVKEIGSFNESCDFFCDYFEIEELENKDVYLNSFPSLHNNYLLYNENKNYNSGFYEKLYVDQKGNIGINIYDNLNLGNIQNFHSSEDFESLKLKTEYQELINIKIDDIAVCNLCEFRYLCTDIKVPKKSLHGKSKYFKDECRFNPFISKWSHEEGYKSLTETGIISNEKEFSIDKDKISSLNAVLWNEEIESK